MSTPTKQTSNLGKIGIYDEPSGGMGGAEYHAVVLAEGLSQRRKVEFIHHHQPLTRERLEGFTGLDLSRVAMRCLPREPLPTAASSLPWRLWHQNSRWRADVSSPYDVFVSFVHGIPPFCHAPKGVLVVLFPFFERNWMRLDPPRGLDPRRRIRDAYYHYEWRRRIGSYARVVSNSEFTRKWTRQYWDVDSTVVYPPVDITPFDVPKQDVVLSVGRFSTTGHSKRQEDIIRTFAGLSQLHRAGWRHRSVGALSDAPADRAHFGQLESMAGVVTSLIANASRSEIKAEFGRAKVFVHAAGFDADESKPGAMEHFGIATVEAMAAGAVPVVVNRGGQPEIVEHGVSGFVWNTLDEMARYIAVLASDETLRDRMAAEARKRANAFSRERFLSQMQTLLSGI